MDPVAARIRGLIASRGQAQKDFAEAVGLDAPKLSKSLAGARRFTSLDLAKIADVCEVTVDWLLTGHETPMATAARAAQGAPGELALRAARTLVTARTDAANAGYRQQWRPLSEVPTGSSWVEAGERLADHARARLAEHGLSATDGDLPAGIEQAFGIDVAVRDLGAGFDGLTVCTDEVRLILIAPSGLPARQRFTLAHELAHVLFGHDQGVHQDVDITGKDSRSGASEVSANTFASAFLMPAATLHTWTSEHGASDGSLCELAVRLLVSPSALGIRLERLGAIDAMARGRLGAVSMAEAARRSNQGDALHAATVAASVSRAPGLLGRDLFAAYTQGEATLRPYATLIGMDVDVLRRDLERRDGIGL